MFDLHYDRLSTKEKDEFAQVVNYLFVKNYVLRDVFNDKTMESRTDTRYRFIERHKDMIEAYLNYSGWHLNVDDKYGVAWIINAYDLNKESLNKATTVLLLVLRLIYDEGREKLALKREILTTVAEVVGKLMAIGTYKKKPSDADIVDSFRKLESYNVLCKLGGKYNEPETKVLIYPTVLFILTDARVKDLYELVVEVEEGDVDEED